MLKSRSFCTLVISGTLLLLVMVGCSKEIVEPPAQADKIGGGPTSGELHNDILANLDTKHDLFGDGKNCLSCAKFLEYLKWSIETTLADYDIEEEISDKQILDCVEEAYDLRELGYIDVWTQEIADLPGLASYWVQKGALTQTEADWYEGLYDELENSPDASTTYSRIIQYGAENGVPDTESNLYQFYDVLLASNAYWGDPAKVSWWGVVVAFSDASGALVGGLAGGVVGGAIGGSVFSVAAAMTEPPADEGDLIGGY